MLSYGLTIPANTQVKTIEVDNYKRGTAFPANPVHLQSFEMLANGAAAAGIPIDREPPAGSGTACFGSEPELYRRSDGLPQRLCGGQNLQSGAGDLSAVCAEQPGAGGRKVQ